MAQMVEQLIRNQQVRGSNPLTSFILIKNYIKTNLKRLFICHKIYNIFKTLNFELITDNYHRGSIPKNLLIQGCLSITVTAILLLQIL